MSIIIFVWLQYNFCTTACTAAGLLPLAHYLCFCCYDLLLACMFHGSVGHFYCSLHAFMVLLWCFHGSTACIRARPYASANCMLAYTCYSTEASAPLVLYYPCAVCARVMRLCPSVCLCVDKKHACLRLTARSSPRKHSLQLPHWIYSPMKTFYVLASLVRAANPWLSKATCSCKSTYGIVGVSPNLLSMSMSSLSLTCTVITSEPLSNVRACVLQ